MHICGLIALCSALYTILIQDTASASEFLASQKSDTSSFEKIDQIDSQLQLFINDTIVQETINIQRTAPNDHVTLADLYSNRGESYLILHQDQKALEDFFMAHQYAINSSSNDQAILAFRALFGAFLVHIRAEDMEDAQTLFAELNTLLKQCACYEDTGKSILTRSFPVHVMTIASSSEPDWPILGPNHISIDECIDRVQAIENSIYKFLDGVKRTDIRVLANIMIDGFAKEAKRCCRQGGLWKGCLQKLVNKLHFCFFKHGVPWVNV